MKKFTRALLRGGTGAGVTALAGGRLALVAVAVAGAACASGGGRPAMTEAEAEALLTDYAGSWVLDESGSSPQIPVPDGPGNMTVTAVVAAQDIERLRREVESRTESAGLRAATVKVLARRPGTLELRTEGTQLVYSPTPGRRISLPVDGGSITEPGLEGRIRVGISWDGPGLEIEYLVGSEGEVHAVLEIVNGRLRMTRTMRVFGETVAPLVLWYDREQG